VYESVLAEIHDKWFESIAKMVAQHIISIIDDNKGKYFLDLGCGSGILLSLLQNYGDYFCGVDISPKMIEKCRNRLPVGHFFVGDILSFELPKVNVITMVGEILSYAFASSNLGQRDELAFFSRVYKCMDTGGLFLFDVLGDQYNYSGQFFHDQEEFTIYSQISQQDFIVNRHIISFLKKGGFYLKSIENHSLKTYNTKNLITQLTEVGFQVKQIPRYNTMDLLPGRIAFECRKLI
jgi:SAM-dependent methyltransferase